jgi:hypothetical protein
MRGAGVIHGGLDAVHVHGRRVRRVAVHRRRGGDYCLRHADGVGNHLAAVVDDAGTHRHDAVGGRVVGHYDGAYGVLVRFHVIPLVSV